MNGRKSSGLNSNSNSKSLFCCLPGEEGVDLKLFSTLSFSSPHPKSNSSRLKKFPSNTLECLDGLSGLSGVLRNPSTAPMPRIRGDAKPCSSFSAQDDSDGSDDDGVNGGDGREGLCVRVGVTLADVISVLLLLDLEPSDLDLGLEGLAAAAPGTLLLLDKGL